MYLRNIIRNGPLLPQDFDYYHAIMEYLSNEYMKKVRDEKSPGITLSALLCRNALSTTSTVAFYMYP